MKKESLSRHVKVTVLVVFGVAVATFDTGCRSTSGFPLKRQRPSLMDGREMIPPAYSEPGEQRTAARPVEPAIGLTPLAPGVFADEPLGDLELPPSTDKPVVELPPPLESETLTYEVKRGDSLWKIARAYGLTHQELAAFNTMDESDRLLVGRVLRIPPGGKFVPPDERVAAPSPRTPTTTDTVPRTGTATGNRKLNEQGTYTVRSGDSLWLIARDFSVKVDDLRRANNLSGDTIHAGQQLVVPGAATRPETIPPEAPPTGGEPSTDPDSETPAPLVPEVVDQGGDRLPDVLPNTLDYTVTEGDTLQNIADMFSIDIGTIRRANPGIQTDADLRPNATIRVPLN